MYHSCVAHLFVVFTTYAFLVLASFGPLTKAIVFDNLPRDNVIVEVVILSMSIMPVCTYPFIMFPIFQILETTVLDSFDVKARLTVRWTLTLATGACAWLFMDYFEPVMAIMGSSSSKLMAWPSTKRGDPQPQEQQL